MLAEPKLKTQTEDAYTLHPYDHRFDAGMAQMWNESDDQWPGTFTDGVPFTTERVAEWMDRISAIIRFIVVENATDKVVGYGDLWETPVRPRSCYVALLNVHPAHQGHSLARRMLTRMVDWAVENGYDRITIGTWPANLKAMPLYKKVGFFWQPDTGVHMENYIPAVRLLAAAQPYFARHDWYRTYRRELKQVEDDLRHPSTGDMKVYILNWQEGDDFIEAIFDRNGQTLTGIATPQWAAYARTGEPEPAQGVSYPFEWEFQNRGTVPLPINFSASADEGIEISQQAALMLQPGESRTFRAAFRVATAAPGYRGDHEDVPTPKIATAIVIGGQALELGTGLRYRQAIEFSLEPAVALTPSIPQTVHLQLHSRTRRALDGEILLDLPDGLTAAEANLRFHLDPEGRFGLPLTLTAASPGFFLLNARASFEDAGSRILTPPKTLAATAFQPGGLAAGLGDKEAILENDYFRVVAKANGGEAEIWDKTTGQNEAVLMEELGLPFVPWDLHEQTYDLALDQREGVARLSMIVASTRFPSLRVGREMIVSAAPLIRIETWVRNDGAETRGGLKLRPHVGINYENNAHVTIPLRERIVREHGSQLGISEDDFPREPERYAEAWLAYERSGSVIGMCWDKASVSQILIETGRHFFVMDLPDLAPGQTIQAAPLHLYMGPGQWQTIQRAWQRLGGQPLIVNVPPAAADSHLAIGFDGGPLASLGREITAQLRTHTTRELKLAGEIEIVPPAGWTVSPGNIVIEPINHVAPAVTAVTLQGPRTPQVGAAPGELRFTSPGFDRSRRFVLFQLGDSSQQVETGHFELEGQNAWQLDNGRTQWTVTPEFHGGIVAWREAGSEVNHLHSSFPQDGEFSWMKPWFGGIRPILHDPAQGNEGFPGKLHREAFSVSPVASPDARGTWQGLKLEADLTREQFRGLRAEIEYLTLPGSNVLKVVYRLVNGTPVYRLAQPGLMGYFQVDGTCDNAVLHAGDIQRKRTPLVAWVVNGPWTAIENPETGRAAAMVLASGRQQLQITDWGTLGAHFNAGELVRVPPDDTHELVAYLALTGSLAEARLYEELKNL